MYLLLQLRPICSVFPHLMWLPLRQTFNRLPQLNPRTEEMESGGNEEPQIDNDLANQILTEICLNRKKLIQILNLIKENHEANYVTDDGPYRFPIENIDSLNNLEELLGDPNFEDQLVSNNFLFYFSYTQV